MRSTTDPIFTTLTALSLVVVLCGATIAQIENEKSKPTNALANETSPYLLMHAHNPVNWYPWSEEALNKAKRENKPIFLSIGYSSCHWCHVMERESFLDKEIAEILNQHFVCIKVDREERPDVDSIYMESLLIINQLRQNGRGGGWPMSMFLTPESQPFYGGAYFPARDGDRGDTVGFLTILKSVRDNWKTREDRVRKDAELVTKITRKSLAGQKPTELTEVPRKWILFAEQYLFNRFDPDFGGFGFNPEKPTTPKFPQASNLFFLVDQIQRDPENSRAKTMLLKTCDQMMMGGIYDHLGGGFHRYSVDRFWKIPHFEKMLYDNGQLVSVYAACYQITQDPAYKDVIDETLAWVQREMTAPGGGFYSALDAESEGEEGKFYRWTNEEIQALLTDEEYQLIAPLYSLAEAPNFEGDFYALQTAQTLGTIAKQKGMEYANLKSKIRPVLSKLLAARNQRERPLLDSKILTSWNGMMIRGFADAGQILKNDKYIETAARAARFGLKNLVRSDGRMWRTHTAGKSKLNAYLDDYACFINGLLALHRVTGSKEWLDAAIRLQQKQDELFWDAQQGGYFFTAADHETLLVRSKNPADNAVPSGTTISAENLLYLASVVKPEDKVGKSEVGENKIGESGVGRNKVGESGVGKDKVGESGDGEDKVGKSGDSRGEVGKSGVGASDDGDGVNYADRAKKTVLSASALLNRNSATAPRLLNSAKQIRKK